MCRLHRSGLSQSLAHTRHKYNKHAQKELKKSRSQGWSESHELGIRVQKPRVHLRCSKQWSASTRMGHASFPVELSGGLMDLTVNCLASYSNTSCSARPALPSSDTGLDLSCWAASSTNLLPEHHQAVALGTVQPSCPGDRPPFLRPWVKPGGKRGSVPLPTSLQMAR